MTIGEKVKAIREAMNMTQQKFAETVGISKAAIQNFEYQHKESEVILENGKVKGVSETALNLILERCKVRREWFITGEGEMFVNDENIPDDADAIVYRILKNGTDTQKEVLHKFAKLNPEQAEAFMQIIRAIASKE